MEAINRTGTKGGVVYWNKEKTRQWLARRSGFNSPQHLGPLSGQPDIPTNHDLGQGRFATGEIPPTRPVDEIKSDLADAESDLKAKTSDLTKSNAGTQAERKQAAAQAAARYRTLRDELSTHPDYVAEQILKQHQAITEANQILKPMGKSFPYPRGDGPTNCWTCPKSRKFSPPAWGWSGARTVAEEKREVFPTRVGMVRKLAGLINNTIVGPSRLGDYLLIVERRTTRLFWRCYTKHVAALGQAHLHSAIFRCSIDRMSGSFPTCACAGSSKRVWVWQN
jgi:hypothetical protein